ncbi:hypothetical protein BDZ89DRAFT_1069351 [Hymenopellis radicata]|nr:hypothetical protein BDZ89DRAFT_1069351 [Hymenopellis radicata]
MKLLYLLALPFSAFTVAGAVPAPAPVAETDTGVSPYIPAAQITSLSERSTQIYCGLLASSVNCRTCASTSCAVVATLHDDFAYWFTCYTTGTVVEGNPNWDYYSGSACYVSAHYTDTSCTTSTLPRC